MFHGHLDIFKNHLLEAGLTQNQETMAPQTLKTVDLFYSIMCESVCEQNFIKIAFGWESGHMGHHTTLEDLWPHYMILEVSWNGLWTLSFGLSQFHGHGYWPVCEVALISTINECKQWGTQPHFNWHSTHMGLHLHGNWLYPITRLRN